MAPVYTIVVHQRSKSGCARFIDDHLSKTAKDRAARCFHSVQSRSEQSKPLNELLYPDLVLSSWVCALKIT